MSVVAELAGAHCADGGQKITSGLDANAEGEIHTLLHSHAAGRTRLLISHRLSALRMADAIAVLSDGAISELGTHDELMRSGQLYARMFTLQAAGYQDARVQEANLG